MTIRIVPRLAFVAMIGLIVTFGAMSGGQTALAADDARVTAITSVTPGSTTLGASTTYSITFVLDSPFQGGLQFSFDQSGCQSQQWDQCSINTENATKVSGPDGDFSAWPGGVNLSGSFTAGTKTLVIGNVLNPNTAASAYRIHGRSMVQGEQENQEARTSSEPFFFGPVAVMGYLTLPNGDPVPNAGANLRTADFSYQSNAQVDQQGFFAFPATGVANGTYFLEFWASVQGYVSPDPVELSYSGSPLTRNVEMQVARKTVSGTVRYDNGNPITTGADIFLNKRGGGGGVNAQVGVDGTYSVSVSGGDWDMNINPGWEQNGPRQVDWVYIGQPQSISFSSDSSIESRTANFTVVKTNAVVKGRILKANDQPMTNASVELRTGDGPGSSTGINPDGTFSINAVAGSYKLNVWFDQSNPDLAQLSFPERNLTVAENQTLDVGTLYMGQKTSKIVGRVTLENGTPIANVSVNCWVRSGFGWGRATTNSSGDYTLWVSSGTWECNLDQGSNSTFIPLQSGQPSQYTVAENQTVTANTILVQVADAQLSVRLVDANGNALSSFGYAFARKKGVGFGPGSEFGAGINQGVATIPLLGGATYIVGVHTPPDQSSYLLESEAEVVVNQGDQKAVTLKMIAPDAKIEIILQDQFGQQLTNVEGDVNAGTEGGASWHNARIKPNGTASIPVRGGKQYFVGYYFQGNSDFIQTPPSQAPFVVPANSTVTKVLTVFRADSRVSATLLDPSGNPVTFGFVWCSNRRSMEGKINADTENSQMIDSGSEARNGQASIGLIAGTYECGAGSIPGQANYMPPESTEVTITPTKPASITLQYRQADATLTGSVTLPDGSSPLFGWCHAWNRDGGFSGGEIRDGLLSIPLSSEVTPWLVGCDTHSEAGFFRSDEKSVLISQKGNVTQNFTLEKKAWNVPQGLTEQFDATVQKTLTLPDGTTMTIPANALATSGNVTLIASPNINLYYTSDTKPVNFAWDFSALDANNQLIESFNSNVNICIPYDQEVLIDDGFNEDDLVAKYYDTTSGVWKLPTGVSQDKDADVVCFSVNHFTNFALASGGAAGATDANIIATPNGAGGPQVVITDETGKVLNTFFAYAKTLRVGIQAVSADVNGDGRMEIITAAGAGAGPQIRVFNDQGQLLHQFFAYGSGLRMGVNLAVGDVDNDGVADIVTTPMAGAGPQIRIFEADGQVKNQFFAYTSTFRGGVSVAIGDVNADGVNEIVSSPDSAAGPQIRVFDENGNAISQFFAYATNVRGGYNVSLGDVNGDGSSDIVVAPKAGNGPQVAAFTYDGKGISRFFAYASTFRGGVNASVGDTDGDGQAEIVVTPESHAGPQVRVFSWDGVVENQFFAYASILRGGFTSMVVDVDADGTTEIITAPGAGMGPQVRVFNQTGKALNQFFTHHTGFRGGISLAPAF